MDEPARPASLYDSRNRFGVLSLLLPRTYITFADNSGRRPNSEVGVVTKGVRRGGCCQTAEAERTTNGAV